MLRHTAFDLDLAFSAGYQIDLRCFLTVNFFTVEKRMEVGHLKRSSSMTKSRLTVPRQDLLSGALALASLELQLRGPLMWVSAACFAQ